MKPNNDEKYDAFLQKLTQGKGKKRLFEFINTTHLQVFPEYKNNPDQAHHLWQLLEYLENDKHIVLPSKNGKLWRNGNPRLPVWIIVNIGSSGKCVPRFM